MVSGTEENVQSALCTFAQRRGGLALPRGRGGLQGDVSRMKKKSLIQTQIRGC